MNSHTQLTPAHIAVTNGGGINDKRWMNTSYGGRGGGTFVPRTGVPVVVGASATVDLSPMADAGTRIYRWKWTTHQQSSISNWMDVVEVASAPRFEQGMTPQPIRGGLEEKRRIFSIDMIVFGTRSEHYREECNEKHSLEGLRLLTEGVSQRCYR